MAFEKRLQAVAPQTLTSNGTSDGRLTIAEPGLFKTRQYVFLAATAQQTLELEVKRIDENGIIFVGPKDNNPESRTDLSAFTTGNGSNLFANEQTRPFIPRDEIVPNLKNDDYAYEEEPTVAKRTLLVDILGNPIDVITVSGIRRLAVDASVSITPSGTQDVNIVNQPVEVTVTNQQSPTISGIVQISGVVDFQRPVDVRVVEQPPINTTISGVIVVSGIAEQPVRVENVVRVSGVVDFQRPVPVVVENDINVTVSGVSAVTISGVVQVSGVSEQPVRVENVVQVSGVVDFVRPVPVIFEQPVTISGIAPLPVIIPEPVSVNVENIVQISGVVDFQRPVPVIFDEPVAVTIEEPLETTVSGVVQISGVVDFVRPVPVIFDEPVAVTVEEPLETTVSGVVQISGVVDFQRPVEVNIPQVVRISGIVDVQRPLPVTLDEPIETVTTITGVVRISGVVDFQRPVNVNFPGVVTTSGVADTTLAGISDFTKFPLFGAHHTIALDYYFSGSGLIRHVGWAEPGSSKSAAVWRIAKLTYSGLDVTDFQWAMGNRLFNKIWNDRVTYIYL